MTELTAPSREFDESRPSANAHRPDGQPSTTAPSSHTGPADGKAASVPDCADMIVIRPERQGGVIFACERPQGHAGEHANGGDAEDYPLVENTSTRSFLLRWTR